MNLPVGMRDCELNEAAAKQIEKLLSTDPRPNDIQPIAMPSMKFCVCGNIEGTAVDDCERCQLISIINEQRSQIQKLQSLPIFDVLERLLTSGHEIKEQDGLWRLFASNGEGVTSAPSVRLLCLNILLMEL